MNSQASGTTAFVGVNVVPMDTERVLRNQTVIVEGGRIAEIGPKELVAVTEHSQIIVAEQKFLIPGLADMHAHIGNFDIPGDESSGNSKALAELTSYLATGITTIRQMAGSTAVLELGSKIKSGEILGPAIHSATPILEGENNVWDHATIVLNEEQADSVVSGYAKDGYEFIKVYHTLSASCYNAVIESGLRNGIRVIGHVPFEVKIEGALKAGQASIEHLRGYDFDGVSTEALTKEGGRSAERFGAMLNMTPERMAQLVEMTVEAEVWNCPTVVIAQILSDREGRSAILQHEYAQYLHPQVKQSLSSNQLDEIFSDSAKQAMRQVLPAQYNLIKSLSDAGAKLLAGTDTMVPYLIPGYTALDEVRNFVDAGLSEFKALQTATSAPHEFLGTSDAEGTIVPGKKADMVLLEGNPLEDVTNLWKRAGVMVGGRWLPKSMLMEMLESLKESYTV